MNIIYDDPIAHWCFNTSPDKNKLQILTDDSRTLFAVIGVDVFGEEKEIQPFLYFDDIVDPGIWIDSIKLPDLYKVVDKGHPIAVLNNLQSRDIVEWARSIPIRPSYLFGNKYDDVSFTQTVISDVKSYPEDIIRRTFTDKDKENIKQLDAKYNQPYMCSINMFVLGFIYNNASSVHILRAFDTVLEERVFDMFCYAIGNELVGVLISVNDSKTIRQKHSAYILGHVHTVRYAKECGFDRVNFLSYLSFKENMNFDREYTKGIRFNI